MLTPITPRPGHDRPVVAVVGETKGGSEVTDFIIPCSILQRSGSFQVLTVGTQSTTLPLIQGSFSIQTDHTLASFDAVFPEGSDIVIVPNQINQKDPLLKSWILAQSDKGAKLVGVCDGVWSLVNAGVLKDKAGTTHWFTRAGLEKAGVKVVKNQRYVEDGNVITTAGVTASIPVSLAIVQAVGGAEEARRVAEEVGVVGGWGSEYDGSMFSVGKLVPKIIQSSLVWHKDIVGLEVVEGVDELTLAVVADVFHRTGATKVVTYGSGDFIVSKNGIKIIPGEKVLPVCGKSVALDTGKPVQVLDGILQDVSKKYGKASAIRAAIEMEYPPYFD
ncbi:UNVERIFIED_CONTAM: hypothetical protein HDU68_011323 [Siphonaria sp. JEL0065]|nr:hypothetical protein HDU68_011323 [Siphonaria sp. JEL0065]